MREQNHSSAQADSFVDKDSVECMSSKDQVASKRIMYQTSALINILPDSKQTAFMKRKQKSMPDTLELCNSASKISNRNSMVHLLQLRLA